jgi:hypothetical protein
LEAPPCINIKKPWKSKSKEDNTFLLRSKKIAPHPLVLPSPTRLLMNKVATFYTERRKIKREERKVDSTALLTQRDCKNGFVLHVGNPG